MNPGMAHPYVITGYLTALTTLAIGVFVYLKNKRSSVHRAFLAYSATIVQWSFFTALQAMQTEPRWALFWGKFCHIGVVFIPVFFYYFSTKITGKENRAVLKAGFLTSFILMVFMLATPYFMPTVRTDVGVNFLVSAGPLYIVIILFFLVYVALSLTHLWKEKCLSQGPRKKHLAYFLWASLVGYGVGVVNFFPVYGLVFFPYPYSAACGSIYFLVLGYAILRHRFLDIELIVKKGTMFSGLFLMIYLAASLLIFMVGLLPLKAPLVLLSGISIALAMFLYEPLKRALTRVTNRVLFQEKIPYTTLIETLTDKLANTPDAPHLSREITGFLAEQLGLDWTALYLREAEHGSLRLTSHRGANLPLELSTQDPLLKSILVRKTPLFLSPFDTEDHTSPELKARLRTDKIEALAPIFVSGGLYGVLLLGKKKSDQEFTKDDELLLQTLAEEAAMFFLSARLLKEQIRANLRLGERIKMAAVTQLARGVHHQVKNPLHANLIRAHALLEDDREGKYDQMPLKDFRNLIMSRLEFMIGQIERIQNSLGTFAQFAHPAEDFDLRPLGLKRELERFLTVMRDGMRLYSIQVIQNVPEDAWVQATEGSLKAVFLNLFNNAYEAMEGRGTLLIAATSDGRWVRLTIRDTGPGIPNEILPNIFEAFFTTKKNTEAVGIGLSTVKHYMDELGGSIEGRNSRQGGAEFILRLKKVKPEVEAHAA